MLSGMRSVMRVHGDFAQLLEPTDSDSDGSTSSSSAPSDSESNGSAARSSRSSPSSTSSSGQLRCWGLDRVGVHHSNRDQSQPSPPHWQSTRCRRHPHYRHPHYHLRHRREAAFFQVPYLTRNCCSLLTRPSKTHSTKEFCRSQQCSVARIRSSVAQTTS